uniref:Uncharacterized protein n=1 Tax=Ditylenchus dipsaci TaxID=166011 RepID=A0A915D3P6_9BILA
MSLPFIFLLFISWGTGSAVQISWLAKHKDEQRGTTFWAHRYQPLANGFSVLLDTDINGSIWTDQTNLTSPISFQIDHVINVSGMALTEAEISEPFTGKAIDWANQYTPANQISDFLAIQILL